MNPKLYLNDIAKINECSLQYVHQKIKENDLTSNKSGNKVYVDNKVARFLIKHDFKKQTFCVHTTKGGVGKTTITMNLGLRFWQFGAKVLLLDLDQQGNLSKSFGYKPGEYNVAQDILEGKATIKESIQEIKENLFILPSALKNALNNQYMQAYGIMPADFLPKQLEELKEEFDIILIDCPPALGPTITSASLSATSVISILDPDDYALDGVEHSCKEIKKLNKERNTNIDFKILLNKYDVRTIVSSSTLSQLQSNPEFEGCLLDTVIGTSQEFVKAKATGVTIYDGFRHNKASSDMDTLARELLGWPTE